MIGTRISHYEIVRLLGRGGMGEVYEGVDLDLDRRSVALKFVAPELTADPEHLKRFEREAVSAAKLNHPNIATVHAFVRDAERPFIDMELISGPSLRARLRHGPLAIPDALAIARDVASALQHAHARGTVHRDIKPENLMFDSDGAVKVMDFGLARAAHASRLTMTGTTMGTAGYMAPEAVRGNAGAPADVFALGVVLYEMLTGTLPFAGDTPLSLMYTIAHDPPAPLEERCAGITAPVVRLVERTLEKKPESRTDAGSIARELSALTGVGAPRFEAITESLDVERLATGEHPAAAQSLESSPDHATLAMPSLGSGALPVPAPRPVPARPRSALPWLLLAAGLVAAIVGAMAFQRASAARRAEAQRLNDEGVAALTRDDLAAAAERLGRAIALDPGSGEAQLNLARLEVRQGENTAAAQRLAAVLRDHRGASEQERTLRGFAYSALADIAIVDGNWGDAVRQLRLAFAEDSSGASAYNQLGHALLRSGAGAEASALLDRGIARFPSVPQLRKNRGLAALAANDEVKAAAAADVALSIDAGYAPALALRARARARSGDLAGATSDFERYFASGPVDSLEFVETVRDLEARGVRLGGATGGAPPPEVRR